MVLIEGHCDTRGSNEYNMALGYRRANAVMNALIAADVDPEQLAVISYGEERLMSRGTSRDDHSLNRRAEFSKR